MSKSKICDCGKEATKYITLMGEIVCGICDDCLQKRNIAIEEFQNSPEQVAFRKEFKEQMDFLNRAICQIAGCKKYCGNRHLEDK